MNQINKFGESSNSSSSGGGGGEGGGGRGSGSRLEKYILNRQEKTDIDLNSLRHGKNIIKSKIITLEANLQSNVTENANFIKLFLEDYSQVIYTKYIERLEEYIQRLEDDQKINKMSDNNNNSNLNADKRQLTEELHRQGRTNFIRRRAIMKGIDDLWQADLVEMRMFTPKGRLISGGSVERQFYPDFYISRVRTAVRSSSPSLP